MRPCIMPQCQTTAGCKCPGTWDISEDKLVSDIACMFFDSQTVRAVPSDYARSVIAAVREHDAAKRPKRDGADAIGGIDLERIAELGSSAGYSVDLGDGADGTEDKR